jgi:hypothetical protein
MIPSGSVKTACLPRYVPDHSVFPMMDQQNSGIITTESIVNGAGSDRCRWKSAPSRGRSDEAEAELAKQEAAYELQLSTVKRTRAWPQPERYANGSAKSDRDIVI